ncbi:SMC-Scp complex subunit ScpB [Patescibacteria group bacterium]|nr:SMC-Scp complex subunit ScpB [Patescibacteria group bacterium]
MSDKKLKSQIESLLFISGKPVKYQKLAKVLEAKTKEVKEAINELNEEYREQERGLSMAIKRDSAQLVSAPANAGFVQKLVIQELQGDLSKAALETLTIILYRSPITRAEVEMIRGVNCIYILRNLLLRGLITKKDSQEDARVSVYEASFDFLKHLGVSKVEELPNYRELREKIEIVKNEDNSDNESGAGGEEEVTQDKEKENSNSV